MKIKDRASGIEFDAEIELVTVADFKIIKKDIVRFGKFDWLKYKGKEVYKLKLKSDPAILGLICIIDHIDPLTNAIEIELLEVAAEHVGNTKKLENIGACLIAFACREAIKRDHDGFVFLIPKTDLIEHYVSYYNFAHQAIRTPNRPNGFLVLFGQTSRALVEKYLE